ncbi:MAG: DUF5011 domain-containing protein, partial [Turicibacter sp.]|nr:DUF5011 domain-containing protein [Turicibacter sp.]
MKKMKPSVKAVLVPALVLTSTAAITYAVPKVTGEESAVITEDNLILAVERIDGDTVKVSLDNVQDIPKSIQFSIQLEGVVLQDGENSIKDLITEAIETSQLNGEDDYSATGVLTDFTYNEDSNTIDVLVTSNHALPKVGNKIEVFELDVKKTDDNGSATYQVLPYRSSEYKYVSLTNKEYSDLGVLYDEQAIEFILAPKLVLTERYVTMTEGDILTAEDLIDQLGIAYEYEGDVDGITLEMLQNDQVITEFTSQTSGLYELGLRAVKDNQKSDIVNIQVYVQLDHVTDGPIITYKGEPLKSFELSGGKTFLPLENVVATDAKGREVAVTVSVDKPLDLDPKNDTEYILTYKATDMYGNTTEVSITVTVLANQAPVIDGAQDRTLKVGETFDPLEGVSVTDDHDQDIELEVNSNVNTKIPGTYKVVYSATDSGGKTTYQSITVTVEALPVDDQPGEPEQPTTPEVKPEEKPTPGEPEQPTTPEVKPE